MRVFHPYGSKERLFEMFRKIGGGDLNEAILPKEKKEQIINEFVKFADEKLGLGNDLPKITTSYDEKEASAMESFGKYTPETNELRVVVVNRNLADVLRTLAHELIHHKQYKEGKLNPNSNDTGSEDENEANSLAGVFMREFGKKNPIIFE
jgi:Zn-dependent peptidase ImmA (M78 family)